MTHNERKDRTIAGIVALVITGLILLLLIFSKIGGSLDSLLAENKIIEEEEEIFLEPELMNLGEPESMLNDEPAPRLQGEPEFSETPSDELVERGESQTPTTQPRQVTQTTESSVQATTPTATEREESRISTSVRNSFNRQNGDQSGTSQNANGSGGTGIGKIGNIKGRTFLGCGNPAITIAKEVTIVVRVTVDENGNVTSASFKSDSGPGAGNKRLRDACVQASRNAKWSAKKGTASQTGTITWRLKPKS